MIELWEYKYAGKCSPGFDAIKGSVWHDTPNTAYKGYSTHHTTPLTQAMEVKWTEKTLNKNDGLDFGLRSGTGGTD